MSLDRNGFGISTSRFSTRLNSEKFQTFIFKPVRLDIDFWKFLEIQPYIRRLRIDKNHPKDTYTIKVEPLGYLTGIKHSGRVSKKNSQASALIG